MRATCPGLLCHAALPALLCCAVKVPFCHAHVLCCSAMLNARRLTACAEASQPWPHGSLISLPGADRQAVDATLPVAEWAVAGCYAPAMLATVPTELPARMPAACSGPTRTVVWGWLQPGGDSSLLQPTMLKGAGLVIGRGQEEYEARQRSGGLPPLPPAPGEPPAEGSWLHATFLVCCHRQWLAASHLQITGQDAGDK